MKNLDFFGQSFILGIAVICALVNLGHSSDLLLVVFIGAIFLGVWQMLSSFLSVIHRSDFHKLKRIHLLGSVFYLLFLVYTKDRQYLFSEGLLIPFYFVVPALLATFHYVLAWKSFFAKSASSGFLRHISF